MVDKVKKIQMRHPTMRFNFTQPGEVFETTEDCVEYLVERYGCEVVEPRIVITNDPVIMAENRKKIEAKLNDDYEFTDTEAEVPEAEDIEVIAPPVETSPGWWFWKGRKYRKNNLPAEAAALLE